MSPSQVPAPARPQRDGIVDFLRGLALLTIFVDHVPGNFLGTLTLRNFGFSDAAELFVLLAGFSSMLAYGGKFATAGTRQALLRVAGRVLRIYLFQIGLLIVTLVVVRIWLTHYGMQPRTIAPMLNSGTVGLRHGLLLHALPSNLNILPLYILLLALFPLIYIGMRLNALPTVLLSAGVWIAANLDADLNLTNWMDGRGWFFNPFAWQFLFTIGVLAARFYRSWGGVIPYRRGVALACWVYLAFALLAAAPWSNWGWAWKPLEIATDKTALAPLRLVNVLAFTYVLASAEWFRRFVEQRWLGFVAMCGRHSLEVFAAGTIVSLFGRLLFRTFGTPWELQALVNGVGFACMIGLALWLDRARRAARRPPALPPLAWHPPGGHSHE